VTDGWAVKGGWVRTGLEGTYRKGPERFVVSDAQLSALTAGHGDLVCPDGPHRFRRRSHRGPAPKRCQGHAKARKALKDRKRRRSPKPAPKPAKPDCCVAAGGTCLQHQQQRRYKYEQAKKQGSYVDGLAEILARGWHVESG
jgi:hypothetical protein